MKKLMLKTLNMGFRFVLLMILSCAVIYAQGGTRQFPDGDRSFNERPNDEDSDVRQSFHQTSISYRIPSPLTAYFFPLNVGNSWTFKSFNQTFTETIVSKRTDVLNNVYYQFDTFRDIANPELSFSLDNALVLRKDAMEQQWLLFEPGTVKQWKVYLPGFDTTQHWMVSLESTTDTVTVPAGHFEGLYRFHYTFNGSDNDWVEWYAPYVGPVKRTLFGFGIIDYELVSWHLDSTTTGRGEIEAPAPAGVELLALFPNPARSLVTGDIRVSSPSAYLNVSVIDILGRQRVTPIQGLYASGVYAIPFRTETLPVGLYCMQVQTGSTMLSRWFTVVR